MHACRVCTYAWISYACMCAYIHAYMHACMHICIHVCTHICIHVCTHTCMCACIYVFIYACVHICMCAYIHVCIYACMYPRMYKYVYACICGSPYAYMHMSMYYVNIYVSTGGGDRTQINYNCQIFKQVFMWVSTTFKHVFTGAPKITYKFSWEKTGVPVTEKNEQKNCLIWRSRYLKSDLTAPLWAVT